MRMPSTRVCMPYTLHTSAEGGPLPGRRNVWISDEAAELIARLGIGKGQLSAYLLEKLREDDRRSAPLPDLHARVHAKREELRRAEEAYEAKAADQDRLLHRFEVAAGQARELVAIDPGRGSVQTKLLRWVRNSSTGQGIREVLPPDFTDDRLVDALLRWPDSRPELVRLIGADPDRQPTAPARPPARDGP